MVLAGMRLGRYNLLHLVGQGGMGEVYLAHDSAIERKVAIKVIRSQAKTKQELALAEQRFLMEAQAIARLDHPYILPLYDYGTEKSKDKTYTFMVMPYRPDGTLKDWLHRLPPNMVLEPVDVAAIVQQAASALQFAHNQHIIHQDVKLSNFLIRQNSDSPYRPHLALADFGIARSIMATAESSQHLRGTPIAMAPEQWRGHPTPASDQYALAVMAYELLTQRPPFHGSLEQVMYAHLETSPQPPSQLRLGLHKDIDEVLLHALAKDPSQRFASVTAFARALQSACIQTYNPNPFTIVAVPTDSHASSSPQHTPSVLEHTRNLAHPEAQSTRSAHTIPVRKTIQVQDLRPFPRTIIVAISLTLVAMLIACLGVTFLYPNLLKPLPPKAQEQKNPYTPLHSHLLLQDPLQKEIIGNKWDTSQGTFGDCYFQDQGFHVKMNIAGIGYCKTTIKTFFDVTMDADMKIIAGDSGGIVLRNDPKKVFYYFYLKTTGEFGIDLYTDDSLGLPVKQVTKSTKPGVLNAGLYVTNKVAIVTHDKNLDFYVNFKKVYTVNDRCSNPCHVALASRSEDLSSAESIFSNAHIWIP